MKSHDEVDFRSLLEATSRSFFLGIEQLKSPLKEDLTLAYLLCRVFDTLEDSVEVDVHNRLLAMTENRKILIDLGEKNLSDFHAKVQALEIPFLPHKKNEAELLTQVPALWTKISSLPLEKRRAFKNYLLPMLDGMEAEVQRRHYQKDLTARDEIEFDKYCYYVAGTVGELITELFRLDSVFLPEAKITSGDARNFGHCLQIVNIVKDFHQDWQEGRCFWPFLSIPSTPKSPLPNLSELEKSKIYLKKKFNECAQSVPRYLEAISATRRDAYFFCAFPFRMAEASLTEAERDPKWLSLGKSFKVSREKTFEIFQSLLSSGMS